MTTTKRVWIPPIDGERLAELVERIKPIVDFPRKGKCYIKPVDPSKVAYTFDPKPTEPAGDLVTLDDITTYHGYGYYGIFKPSIAEVLAQIPTELIDRVVAFEIIDWPRDASDLNREREALDAGYHVATTRLYGRK